MQFLVRYDLCVVMFDGEIEALEGKTTRISGDPVRSKLRLRQLGQSVVWGKFYFKSALLIVQRLNLNLLLHKHHKNSYHIDRLSADP